MIDEIKFEDEEEIVYSLDSIGLIGELVISKTDGIYIMTEDDVFAITENIKELILKSEDSFSMENTDEDDEYIEEGKSVLNMSKEQVQIIKDILKNI